MANGAYHTGAKGAYSSPSFYSILRAGVKGRRWEFSVHDVAFASFICSTHLRQVNLQKKSMRGFDHEYQQFLDDVMPFAGKDIVVNNDITFQIVPGKDQEYGKTPTDSLARCV